MFLLLVQAALSELPPKMPLFVGMSYDLLEGNPLSSGVDPGFLAPLFEFTFENGSTTSDGKYLIPDGVSATKVSSCAFQTSIKTYRGTKSYQEQLRTKAQVQGGYKSSITQASFSLSTNYFRVEKQTIESNESITHATASCQAYSLTVNLFKANSFVQNFVAGVSESYKNKNWTKFIIQFGTHFVYEVVMGGRAVQQITYDFTSVSKLNSLGIDISIAAKASFAKFFGDSSFDWSKHTQQIAYSQTLSKTIQQIYIGGQPARNGDIGIWASKVIDNPMPISYKLMDTAILFELINITNINVEEAVSQYHQALQQYCARIQCRPPVPDRPKPLPALITLQKTPNYGGNGGHPFTDFKVESPTINAVKFLLRHGSGIDNLQMMLSDGVKNVYTPQIGGTGGSPATWDVPQGQWVSQIEYKSSDQVYSLTFITNKGVKSPHFGGNGGNYFLVTIPDQYRLVGFYGREGSRIDQLGFIVAKTIYPDSEAVQQMVVFPEQNLRKSD